MIALLVVHAAATWFMTGLIWVIQAVHYPLFAAVGEREFPEFEAGHTRRIGRLLALPAITEIASAAALVWARPDQVSLGLVLAAGVVLAGIWVTTGLVQAPLHSRLSKQRSAVELTRLVTSNWWRTAGWTGRGALVGAMLVQAY